MSPGTDTADPSDRPIGDGERRIIDGFRRRLGPPPSPEITGVEVAHLHLPRGHEAARVGGDFIDFYSAANLQQIAVVVGDVAGKGVDSAFDALSAKTATRTIVMGMRWPPLPGEALQETHNALLDATLKQGTHITMVFGLMNGRDGGFSFASAGHPCPLVLRRDKVERPMALVAPAIGVTWEAELQPYPTESLTLDDGEGVLLFTDGIAEARDSRGRFYEDARLLEALEELRGLSAAELLQRLLADLTKFAGGPPSDDLALVYLKRCAPLDE